MKLLQELQALSRPSSPSILPAVGFGRKRSGKSTKIQLHTPPASASPRTSCAAGFGLESGGGDYPVIDDEDELHDPFYVLHQREMLIGRPVSGEGKGKGRQLEHNTSSSDSSSCEEDSCDDKEDEEEEERCRNWVGRSEGEKVEWFGNLERSPSGGCLVGKGPSRSGRRSQSGGRGSAPSQATRLDFDLIGRSGSSADGLKKADKRTCNHDVSVEEEVAVVEPKPSGVGELVTVRAIEGSESSIGNGDWTTSQSHPLLTRASPHHQYGRPLSPPRIPVVVSTPLQPRSDSAATPPSDCRSTSALATPPGSPPIISSTKSSSSHPNDDKLLSIAQHVPTYSVSTDAPHLFQSSTCLSSSPYSYSPPSRHSLSLHQRDQNPSSVKSTSHGNTRSPHKLKSDLLTPHMGDTPDFVTLTPSQPSSATSSPSFKPCVLGTSASPANVRRSLIPTSIRNPVTSRKQTDSSPWSSNARLATSKMGSRPHSSHSQLNGSGPSMYASMDDDWSNGFTGFVDLERQRRIERVLKFQSDETAARADPVKPEDDGTSSDHRRSSSISSHQGSGRPFGLGLRRKKSATSLREKSRTLPAISHLGDGGSGGDLHSLTADPSTNNSRRTSSENHHDVLAGRGAAGLASGYDSITNNQLSTIYSSDTPFEGPGGGAVDPFFSQFFQGHGRGRHQTSGFGLGLDLGFLPPSDPHANPADEDLMTPNTAAAATWTDPDAPGYFPAGLVGGGSNDASKGKLGGKKMKSLTKQARPKSQILKLKEKRSKSLPIDQQDESKRRVPAVKGFSFTTADHYPAKDMIPAGGGESSLGGACDLSKKLTDLSLVASPAVAQNPSRPSAGPLASSPMSMSTSSTGSRSVSGMGGRGSRADSSSTSATANSVHARAYLSPLPPPPPTSSNKADHGQHIHDRSPQNMKGGDGKEIRGVSRPSAAASSSPSDSQHSVLSATSNPSRAPPAAQVVPRRRRSSIPERKSSSGGGASSTIKKKMQSFALGVRFKTMKAKKRFSSPSTESGSSGLLV
ncbi:hypothetical protein IE53DRAFT_367486 [Violaceomyces palustris]|uniref:Uncharacterized protein n=1 Tax=Violaceomyces palustris TaxID=1673888 RepID=A0ACD0P271_9BASI|nr:hypothetical protein IE53DRAFT_367486 [Violaceomyces palustris]